MKIQTRPLVWLTLFAVAMAYVESTLVVHLRNLYYANDPLSIFPLQLMTHRDLAIELAREAATVVMIFSVALLAAPGRARRFAAFVFVFGVWDLFYYLWLKVILGWPKTWFEWDILFLIPWPWLGPWITPALIALLFTLWGGWVLLFHIEPCFNRVSVGLFLAGSGLGLAAFLWPGALLLPGGEQAFANYQPDNFPWPIYTMGLISMSAGLIASLRGT